MTLLVKSGTTQAARAHRFLRPAGEVTLHGSTDPFDPYRYFENRTGLYVGSDFKKRILSAAQRTNGFPEMTVGSFDLVKPAYDTEIRSEGHDDHVFENTGEFCAILAGMIDKQPNGGEGNLLSNGDWTIFYVHGADGEIYAVYDSWQKAPAREWLVYADKLDSRQRRAGSRVFFPQLS